MRKTNFDQKMDLMWTDSSHTRYFHAYSLIKRKMQITRWRGHGCPRGRRPSERGQGHWLGRKSLLGTGWPWGDYQPTPSPPLLPGESGSSMSRSQHRLRGTCHKCSGKAVTLTEGEAAPTVWPHNSPSLLEHCWCQGLKRQCQLGLCWGHKASSCLLRGPQNKWPWEEERRDQTLQQVDFSRPALQCPSWVPAWDSKAVLFAGWGICFPISNPLIAKSVPYLLGIPGYFFFSRN